MNNRIRMASTNLPFALVSILAIAACNTELGPPIENVSEIKVSDNGNAGNGSDIEVNFVKQFKDKSILEYRILIVKAAVASSITVELANDLAADRYTVAAPDDIIPIRGKTLTADALDIDGDLITGDEIYQVAVLTVSSDSELATNSIVLDDETFKLSINNLVFDHTEEFDAGAGSLVMTAQGELLMAGYDVHTHLGINEEGSFIYRITESSGQVMEISESLELLSGNALDSEQNLYQSILLDGRIAKLSPAGTLTLLQSDPLIASPDGIHINSNNELFVVDREKEHVVRITAGGVSGVHAKVGPEPRGIASDDNGNLYISHNSEDGRITKISPNGEVEILANIPTFVPSWYTLEFVMWAGYIIYHDGFLYVAGTSTNRIYKVSLAGAVEVFAGSGERGIPRGGALFANLNRPMGLAFSNDGKSLFVSGCTDVTPQHTQYTRPAKVWEIRIEE